MHWLCLTLAAVLLQVVFSLPSDAASVVPDPLLAAQPVPLPLNAEPTLQSSPADIACATKTDCVAIGSYNDIDGRLLSYVDVLALDTGLVDVWTSHEAPVPEDAADDPRLTLTAVSCPSANWCAATGIYQTGEGANAASRTVSETYSAGAWPLHDCRRQAGSPRPSMRTRNTSPVRLSDGAQLQEVSRRTTTTSQGWHRSCLTVNGPRQP
jgi:hypothetical protein